MKLTLNLHMHTTVVNNHSLKDLHVHVYYIDNPPLHMQPHVTTCMYLPGVCLMNGLAVATAS